MKSILAKFPTDTTLLEATERYVRMKLVGAVDPCSSGFQLVRSLDGPVDVLREYSGGQSVHGVVGLLDNVCLISELDDDADGTEDLLLYDPHVGSGVGEDSRGDEVTLRSVTLASSVDSGAF